MIGEIQDWLCGICDRDFDDWKDVIDHDRVTHLVRGLLCYGCNISIGKTEDTWPSHSRMQPLTYLDLYSVKDMIGEDLSKERKKLRSHNYRKSIEQ